jgi:hypothetical protein
LMYGSAATAVTMTLLTMRNMANAHTETERFHAVANGFTGPFFGIMTTAWIAMIVLLMVGNMSGVPVLPTAVRNFFRVGLRERLWRSRFGAWLAQRLGEPERSLAVGAGLFRATEVVLGAALGELYSALPTPYREQLSVLPSVVAALEARAAAARSDLELLDALPTGRPGSDDLFESRREEAKTQLGSSVAALEGIRLDLLRLHAGASDLQPLTTLLEAAMRLGEDMNRLAVAQQDGVGLPTRRLGAERVPTPV